MLLKIKVKPNSPVTKLSLKNKRADIDLVVEIKSPAEDNKANIELIKFMSEKYNVSIDEIKIKRGLKSSIKVLEIPDNNINLHISAIT